MEKAIKILEKEVSVLENESQRIRKSNFHGSPFSEENKEALILIKEQKEKIAKAIKILSCYNFYYGNEKKLNY